MPQTCLHFRKPYKDFKITKRAPRKHKGNSVTLTRISNDYSQVIQTYITDFKVIMPQNTKALQTKQKQEIKLFYKCF